MNTPLPGDTPDDPQVAGLAARLERERPLPHPGFRSRLRHELMQHRTTRPRRFWLLVSSYGLSGTALLAVVAVGVAGAGPLAA